MVLLATDKNLSVKVLVTKGQTLHSYETGANRNGAE